MGSIQPPSRFILLCDQTRTLNIPTWWSDILHNLKRYDGPNLIVPMSTNDETTAADRLEERVGGGGRGGFQPDSRVRRAIEHHAMKRAAAHFKRDGWTVEDTQVGNPFDLRISRRGEVVQVEVKGTTGDGAEVVLTRREVESAERVPSALFILRQVKITWISDEPIAIGGEPILYMPWRVHDGRLTAVSYFYQPPGK